MAIIVKCDKCGVTAENHQDIKVVDDKPGDYHQRWAFMIAGSGMDLYPEHLGSSQYRGKSVCLLI